MEHTRAAQIRGWVRIVAVIALMATFAVFAPEVRAQAGPGAKTSTGAPAAKPAAPAPPVSQDQAIYLVRATLLTLNDANRSGNYTVLRDLAAPDFQAKNTAADLAQSFADLRRRNFDLFAAALLTPQFTTAPALDANGWLHLTGYFATRPLQINFDLIFQIVGGQWRLFGISVATPEVTPKTSGIANPPGRRSASPFYGVRVLSGTVGLRW
jgi:hypothetical protein